MEIPNRGDAAARPKRTHAALYATYCAAALLLCARWADAAAVSYFRAYDLGPAGHVEDLGLLDGDPHLAVQQDGEIKILSVSSTGFSVRARITNPLSGDWGTMLTAVPDADSDGVREIATYGRDSAISGDHTFYLLRANLPPGTVVGGDVAAIYTLPFGPVLPRYASVKPGSADLWLTEFPDTARRRNSVTGSVLHTVTGAGVSNGGAWIGDLDGDTVPDVLTGGEASIASSLFVISGADLTDGPAAARAIRVFSDPDTPGLGYAEDGNNIAVAFGDINGDGVSEVAIGSRLYRIGPDGTNFGRVVVFDGANGAVLYRIEPDQTNTNGVYFGNNLVAPGDLNGDGTGDFIVSARGYGAIPGAFGDGALIGVSGVDGAELFRHYGNQEGLGDYELTLIEDLNADGIPDLGVGSLTNGSVWLSDLDDGSSSLYTLSPCRLLDTRDPAGPYGGPALASDTDRVVSAPGRCGVPAWANQISVNLTVANASAAGHLALFAEGESPPLSSTVNFEAGQVRSNNAILPLSNGRFVARPFVLGSGFVDLIVDVNGFFR